MRSVAAILTFMLVTCASAVGAIGCEGAPGGGAGSLSGGTGPDAPTAIDEMAGRRGPARDERVTSPAAGAGSTTPPATGAAGDGDDAGVRVVTTVVDGGNGSAQGATRDASVPPPPPPPPPPPDPYASCVGWHAVPPSWGRTIADLCGPCEVALGQRCSYAGGADIYLRCLYPNAVVPPPEGHYDNYRVENCSATPTLDYVIWNAIQCVRPAGAPYAACTY